MPPPAAATGPSTPTKPDPALPIVDVAETTEEPIVYQGQHSAAPAGGGFDLNSSPRLVFWGIYGLLHFGLPLWCVVIAVGSPPSQAGTSVLAGGFACVWTLFGFFPSWFAAKFLTPAIITAFQCPHCFAKYEARARWTCNCGYVDHREQHILSFKCPLCRTVIGHTDCRHCGATIIVR